MKNFTLSASILGTTLAVGCSQPLEKATEVVRPVRTQKVTMVGGSRVRRFSGVIQAGQESRLSFKVGGTLKSLKVKIGDRVSKGKLIAELDPGDLSLSVQQARAALSQTRAQMINAKAAYERTRKLYETNSTAKSNLDATRAAYASARAAVTSTSKQLQMARSQLTYATIRAPIDGTIAATLAEVNENVSPGKPIVVLQGSSVPEVKITVPDVLISQVRKGAKAQVALDAVKDKAISATVNEVGVVSESLGSTYPVTLTLDDAPPGVRPGMAAEVAFQLGTAKDKGRVVVPLVAVAQDRKGRFVFVAEPKQGSDSNAIVRRRQVTVGELTTGGLEIKEGINDGELLITAGVSQIRNGLEVRLLPQTGTEATKK